MSSTPAVADKPTAAPQTEDATILADLEANLGAGIDDEDDEKGEEPVTKEDKPKAKSKAKAPKEEAPADEPPAKDDDDDAEKGALRREDYTRKTQELAEQRKAFEAEKAEWEASLNGKTPKSDPEDAAKPSVVDESKVLESLGLDYKLPDMEQLNDFDIDEAKIGSTEGEHLAEQLMKLRDIMVDLAQMSLWGAAMGKRSVAMERQVAQEAIISSIETASSFIKKEYGTELDMKEAIGLLRTYRDPLRERGHTRYSPEAVVEAYLMHNTKLTKAKETALDKAAGPDAKTPKPPPTMVSGARGSTGNAGTLDEDAAIMRDLEKGSLQGL